MINSMCSDDYPINQIYFFANSSSLTRERVIKKKRITKMKKYGTKGSKTKL